MYLLLVDLLMVVVGGVLLGWIATYLFKVGVEGATYQKLERKTLERFFILAALGATAVAALIVFAAR